MEYPNGFTPIDNDLMNEMIRYAPSMGTAGVRIWFLIARKTFGWQKDEQSRVEWFSISIRDIAKVVGTSETEVNRSMKRLVDAKMIDKCKPTNKSVSPHTSVHSTPNKYRICKHLRRSKSYKNSGDVVTKRVTIRWTNTAQAVWLELSFSKFWKAYPKHINKKGAKKSWVKIRLSVNSAKKIIKAVKAQSKSEQWVKDSGQYVPHPTTWLNQERWDDVVEKRDTNNGRNF